jgi:hypothetical protein
LVPSAVAAAVAAAVDVCVRAIDVVPYARAYAAGDFWRAGGCFGPCVHVTCGDQQYSHDVAQAFSPNNLHQCSVATVCCLYAGWWPVNPVKVGAILEGRKWTLGRFGPVLGQ